MVTIEDIDEAPKQEGEQIAIQLPEDLGDFSDVFSPKKADKLPPHRSYDHEIKLSYVRPETAIWQDILDVSR